MVGWVEVFICFKYGVHNLMGKGIRGIANQIFSCQYMLFGPTNKMVNEVWRNSVWKWANTNVFLCQAPSAPACSTLCSKWCTLVQGCQYASELRSGNVGWSEMQKTTSRIFWTDLQSQWWIRTNPDTFFYKCVLTWQICSWIEMTLEQPFDMKKELKARKVF